MKINLLFFCCVLILTSCENQPVADFITHTSNLSIKNNPYTMYYGKHDSYGTYGDTIFCTNTSLDSKSYRWTLPNGTTSGEKDLVYVIEEKDSVYITEHWGQIHLSLTLEAFSKSGKRANKVIYAIYGQ